VNHIREIQDRALKKSASFVNTRKLSAVARISDAKQRRVELSVSDVKDWGIQTSFNEIGFNILLGAHKHG